MALLPSELPLLSQWALMQTEVLPRLAPRRSSAGQPSVWAHDDVSDAVALSVAFGYCRRNGRDGRRLRVYATPAPGHSETVHFSTGDLRSIPPPARQGCFRRTVEGWVPADEVAERVLLGPPTVPVDLVVLRGAHTGDPTVSGATLRLRPGGHVLVLGSDPVQLVGPGLKPVQGTPLLRWMGRPDRSGRGAEEAGADARSLARALHEEELVESYLNLARSLSRRFSGHGEPADDLRQVAYMGLVLAARRYDPSKNASFATFATATILGELKRYFRDKSWMMRVPRQVQENYLAAKIAREELCQELACSPTISQIAGRVGVTDEAVLEAMEAGDNFVPQSLDSSVDPDSPGRDVPLTDMSFDVMLERNVLMQALPMLPQRQQLVLKLVYLDGWTQRRVAQEIGVSQMHVSRLLRASTQKVRAWTEA